MGWFKDFAGEITDAGGKEVSRAGHDFRKDAGVREGKDKGLFNSPTSWGQTKEDAHPDNRENYGKDK